MEKTINSQEDRQLGHKAVNWVLVDCLIGSSGRLGLGGQTMNAPATSILQKYLVNAAAVWLLSATVLSS